MNQSSSEQQSIAAVIIIMGATGTGKSTFINLLTNDDTIRIGHTQQSETFGVQTAYYVDRETGRPVMLIDTPGFDDSREGVTDTDILEKFVQFLEPKSSAKVHVNGIIYMHRISDPRVGGVSRKNLRMFRSLCGEENFSNVCIVTTNWNRVSEEEGNHREEDLRTGAFKALVDAGAHMHRHANTLESAHKIMADLIPLEVVTMKIQEEVRSGKKLSDTDAGRVLTADMQEREKKHIQEMADLEREMNDAAKEKNLTLQAELEEERKALEERMARAHVDRKRLQATFHVERAGSLGEQGRSERPTQPYDMEMDISEASKVDQTQHDSPTGADHQVTNHSSGTDETMLGDAMYPNGLPDMTRGDEMAQTPRKELANGRHVLQEPENLQAECHLEVKLQELNARIGEVERKKAPILDEAVCELLTTFISKLAAKRRYWWDRESD